MGTGKALRAFRRDINVISVHPNDALHGIEGTKYLEEGAIVPGIFDKNFPNAHRAVGTEAAFDMTKRLCREEGIFVGTSSGAAMVAALKTAEQLDQGTVVVMFPDGGDRYLSREI